MALGIATDIGGGTSYSMLATLGEAYKVQMLDRLQADPPPNSFTWRRAATPQRLHLDDQIGIIEVGKWADLVVLDPRATPVLASRQDLSQSLEDVLFSLMILGDDRAVRATYVAGRKLHERLSA